MSAETPLDLDEITHPVIDVWAARERARCGDRDGAIPQMRAAIDDLFRSGQLGSCVPATGLLVVPYAVAGTGYDVLVPIAAGLTGFIAVRPLMDGLRSVCRSIGLVRALGMDLRELRVIMSVVPGAFAALWAALATPALGSPAVAFAVAAGMLTGAVRQASARPPSYSGPLVASPMGAIPPGLFTTPMRGFDLLLLCLAPVLLGLGGTWVVAIPAVVCLILFAVNPKQN